MMADIKKELNDIKNAVYGREVRSSIHDGIKKINEESEESKQKAEEAHEITQDLLDETFDSAALEANFEQRLNDEIENLQPEWTGFKNDVTAQLAQTMEKTRYNPNSENFLFIPTYDGVYHQTTHPDVIYFEDGWNGYKYWMAHTPYPYGNNFFENPSIVCSNDGIEWVNPDGLENPIDSVTEEENNRGVHLSDAILVYANGLMECWYRYTDNQNRIDRLYRQTSIDGKNWGSKQKIYEFPNTKYHTLSPSVVYEDGLYRMWFVENDTHTVRYMEASNDFDWTEPIEIPLQFKEDVINELPWHLDIFKENESLYHIIINTRESRGRNRELLWGTSSDGMSFENITTIMTTPTGQSTWDNVQLYRASLIKVGGTYKLYYSALGVDGRMWHIGLSEGERMDALTGSKNITGNSRKSIPQILSNNVLTDRAVVKRQDMRTSENEEKPYLKFIQSGVAGAGIKTGSSNNRLQIVNDSGDDLGSLELYELIVNYLSSTDGRIIFLDDLWVSVPDSDPSIVFRRYGHYSARVKIIDSNRIAIRDENDEINGHLHAASVVVGNTNAPRPGAIRFNSVTRKHQGYDGEKWNDMY